MGVYLWALWGTARCCVLFGALMLVTGYLLAAPTTDDAPRAPVVTQPTAAVTEQSVRDLIDEMRALTTTATPVTPTASSVVAQAEEVLEAVERGEVHVAPAPTTTTTTATTAPPATTTTTAPEAPLEWPDEELPAATSTVPPAYTETIP